MQTDNNGKVLPWTCPRCGKETTDYPAISREDNQTEICSQCGTDEAMANWFKYTSENK